MNGDVTTQTIAVLGWTGWAVEIHDHPGRTLVRASALVIGSRSRKSAGVLYGLVVRWPQRPSVGDSGLDPVDQPFVFGGGAHDAPASW